MQAVKIKSFTVKKRELKQLQITNPKNWAEDVGLEEGDTLNILRDSSDRLIVVPEKKQTA